MKRTPQFGFLMFPCDQIKVRAHWPDGLRRMSSGCILADGKVPQLEPPGEVGSIVPLRDAMSPGKSLLFLLRVQELGTGRRQCPFLTGLFTHLSYFILRQGLNL